MKLWNANEEFSKEIHQFTVGNDRLIDLKIAKHDLLASTAHVKMLNEIGVLNEFEKSQLLKGLERIQIQLNTEFNIPEEMEDIHSYIEFQLTEWYGDVGKKIHTARSRNDQVLVAIHLYIKEELHFLIRLVKDFGLLLCDLAERFENHLIPGYTHTQVAMPSSGGMWLSGYAECLADDLVLLNAALQIADQNPLGTAAGYGTCFPIDRDLTTKYLEFSQIKVNPIAAQLNRGKLEMNAAFACSQVALTIGKLANDCVLFLSQNFNFISIPKNVGTGSSIMPHKNNPDVFELVRSKSGIIGAIPLEISMITRNLISGYHRDFQLLKEPLIKSIDLTKEIIKVMQFIMPSVTVNNIDLSDKKYLGIFSVDNVAMRVLEGSSFREAYLNEKTSNLLANTSPETTIHIGSLNNLQIDIIRKKIISQIPE